MNIVEDIFAGADRSAIALIGDDRTLTYGELIDEVEKTVAQFGDLLAGNRVGLSCPNGIDHVVRALAIVRGGGCLVPIPCELSPAERDSLIRITALSAVVQPDGEIVRVKPATPDFDEKAFQRLNPAFIRFSSGTTGNRKGIVLSHESLVDRVTAANRGLGISAADRIVWILPMAHHFAVSIMLYLQYGAATVITKSHLAEDVLHAGRKHGGTVLYGAPFHHSLLAGEPSGASWPTLRLAVSVAAPLPVETAKGFLKRYQVPLVQGLGIIEVGLPLLNVDSAREKPGSVGRPLPDYEVQVRDVPAGDVGEIWIRGPGMFDAYLSPWHPRDQVLVDGWFRTGDLGQIDPDGHLYLTGRSHSVINVAGMKCFPEEIEAVLGRHPGVAAARVIGKKNARTGLVPVAELIPRDPALPPSVGSLVAHCRSSLARFKIPVEFRFVEEIPRTKSGKIQR